ncbi:MAG: hypothetical protein Q4G60_07595 [bacterium]|nr:hypothetical protein [bacterium]
MMINSSNISMGSSRNYSKETSASVSITRGTVSGLRLLGSGNTTGSTIKANNGVSMTISEESKQMMARLRQMKRDQQKQERYQLATQSNKVNTNGVSGEKSEDEIMIETLKRILETLNKVKQSFTKGRMPITKGQFDMYDFSKKMSKDLDSFFSGYSSQGSMSTGLSLSNTYMENSQVNLSDGRGVNGIWVKQTVASSFMSEEENTAFTSVGNVTTADGRSIDFGITLEMSRSYMEQNEYLQEEAGYIFTDPLVINLDSNVASVSDQKFLFDIDADGHEDNISFVDGGSGFLALDKNGDGKINDGNELFGTKSGDGFKDLAAYDKDGNGWIDEADDVFKDLKIWTKDQDGNDRLLNLKEAGVGALFLGNVSTQFSLNNQETNETNGVIRSTGVYLRESGEVGTLQHVDLAV